MFMGHSTIYRIRIHVPVKHHTHVHTKTVIKKVTLPIPVPVKEHHHEPKKHHSSRSHHHHHHHEDDQDDDFEGYEYPIKAKRRTRHPFVWVRAQTTQPHTPPTPPNSAGKMKSNEIQFTQIKMEINQNTSQLGQKRPKKKNNTEHKARKTQSWVWFVTVFSA